MHKYIYKYLTWETVAREERTVKEDPSHCAFLWEQLFVFTPAALEYVQAKDYSHLPASLGLHR